VKQSVEHKFTVQTPQNWAEAATKELEDGKLLSSLTVKKSGITLKPYYTSEDCGAESVGTLPVSTKNYGAPRHWINMPRILAEDAQQANTWALLHLQNGADGIYFHLKNPSIKVEQLLDKVELHYCSINFLVNEHSIEFLDSYFAFAEAKFSNRKIMGNLFWEGGSVGSIVQKFKQWELFHAGGLQVPYDSSAANQLANALKEGVDRIESFHQIGLSVDESARHVCFSVELGNDFFIEAIKLRVLRTLWHNILGAYQVKKAKPVFIQAISSAWSPASFQPQGNLIKETYCAMAAILGGCDGLTIEPEDITNATMVRMARNVSSVLREESFLSAVADPLAGSYFIESATKQLAEEAWGIFQKLVTHVSIN
jgi:methylmalonyl-CoA mutase